MVDALRRAHRMLRSGGRLVDLHPTAAEASVEVGPVCTGLVDARGAPSRYAAAGSALAAVVGERLFANDRADCFTFYTYGDSIEELRDYIVENWRDATIDDETMRRTRDALGADARSRPRIRERVHITTLRLMCGPSPAKGDEPPKPQ